MSSKTQVIVITLGLFCSFACKRGPTPADRDSKRTSEGSAPLGSPQGTGPGVDSGGASGPAGLSTALSCTLDIDGKDLCVQQKSGLLDICLGLPSASPCDEKIYKKTCEQTAKVEQESADGVISRFDQIYVYFFNDDLNADSVCDTNPIANLR